MSSDSANGTWPDPARPPEAAPATGMPAAPGRPADGNNTLIRAPASEAAGGADPGDQPGQGSPVSRAFIYGYDADGNPTLADADR